MKKWRKKQKILKIFNILYKSGWYKQRNVWNGVKTIVDNDWILWLTEKNNKRRIRS